MTADKSETVDQEKLLSDFKTRYQNLIGENQNPAGQINQSETQALKLQGAIETLEYILQPGEEVDEVSTAE